MANNNIIQPVIRSISLPSREHPCLVRIESLLNDLKPRQQDQVPHDFNTVQTSLVLLSELYAYVDELIIRSPTTQQVAEQALEHSITLIDTCNAARDFSSAVNEHVRAIQSALRRRKLQCDPRFETKVNAYLRFRNKAKRDIAKKCLLGLKRIDNNNSNAITAVDHCQDLALVVKALRETSSITVSILRAVLNLLSTSSTRSKSKGVSSGWYLVSKLVRKRECVCYSDDFVANVDVSLESVLRSDECAKSKSVQRTQEMLETLNSSTESLVLGLDCMFRCLVRNRVSLLNILTQ